VRGLFAIVDTVAVVLFVSVCCITWRRRAQNPAIASALVAVMFGASWWATSDVISAIAPNDKVASIAWLAGFTGVSIAAVGFVWLGLAVTRPRWVPGRRGLSLLLVEPVAITLAAATNPWHQLVERGPGAATLTEHAGWTFGPVFWVHAWYCYLALATAVALLAWGWLTAQRTFRRQSLALFVASLTPVVVNAVFLSGGFGDIPDPTLLGFAVTGTIITYSIFYLDLFIYAPVARALIVDQIGDAIVAISPANRVLDLNLAAIKLVRDLNPAAPAELVGASARELFAAVTGGNGSWTASTADLRAGASEFHVRSSPLIDRRRRRLGTVYVARDVTEANAQTRRLSLANEQLVRQVETIDRLRADLVELAGRDPLTGLHNRRYLIEMFAPMLAAAERDGVPLAVALVDVDRFKAINDHYGHLVGDEVLVALAHRIRAQVPAGALVARWGGEEFFVAFPGADAAAGLAVADGVRHWCERDGIDVAGSTLSCTVSIGVATYPESGTTMNELFHAADLSLYAAKDAGRNSVRLHRGVESESASEPTRR